MQHGQQEVQRLQARLAAAEKQLQSRQLEASHGMAGTGYTGVATASAPMERLVVTTGVDVSGGRTVQLQSLGGRSQTPSVGLTQVGAGYTPHAHLAGGVAGASCARGGYEQQGVPGAVMPAEQRLTIRMTSDAQGGTQRHALYVQPGMPGAYGAPSTHHMQQGVGGQAQQQGRPAGPYGAVGRSGAGAPGQGHPFAGRGPWPGGPAAGQPAGAGGRAGRGGDGRGRGMAAEGRGRGRGAGRGAALQGARGGGARGSGPGGRGGASGAGAGSAGTVAGGAGSNAFNMQDREAAQIVKYDVHILAMNSNVALLKEALSMSSGRREVRGSGRSARARQQASSAASRSSRGHGRFSKLAAGTAC